MDYLLDNSKDVFNIAIIGCGASSVLILEALCNCTYESKRKLNISIFEKSDRFGRGIAYKSTIKHLILNTSVDTMSVNKGNSDDFTNWLGERGIPSEEGVPRGIYGDYLEYALKNITSTLNAKGHYISFYRASIESVKIGNGFLVRFSGEDMHFDSCIIATGGEISVPENLCEVSRKESLSIFDEDKIASVVKGSKIAVIGSGQSAIDACIMMENLGIKGFYSLVSRSGILPRVKSIKGKSLHEKELFTDALENKNLDCLYDFVKNKIHWKASQFEDRNIRPASFRSMKIDLLRSLKNLPSWQQTMISITPYINQLWANLTHDEKFHFQDFYQRGLHHLRSAIMPVSAIRFLNIYNDGRLSMIWGDYHINRKVNGFDLSMKGVFSHFDYVINTSGIKASSHIRIMSSEISKGCVSTNYHNGFCVDYGTMQLLDCNGNINRGLYAIGYPTQGAILISNSIELLRESAINIAASISKNINEGFS